MGSPASRGVEPCSGHSCYPPSVVNPNCSTVFINGKPAHKVGAPMVPHTCQSKPYPSHGSSVSAGSGSVNFEGAPAVRCGDPIGCGSVLSGGSGDVFVG